MTSPNILSSLAKITRLILFLALLFFSAQVNAAPASQMVNIQAEPYTIQLSPTDTVMRNPNGSVNFYFTLNQGSQINGPAVFDLWYSYSPITLPDISTMTVLINNVPINSQVLLPSETARSNWQVAIPAENFQEGLNEITLSVVHRTIDGLCRDIDNEANWFIINADTRLSFNLSRAAYSLASFPRPFTDEYLSSKTNTVLYLPADYDNNTLAALLTMASILGKQGIINGMPQRLEVRVGEPGQVAANEIVFGRADKWFPAENVSERAPVVSFETLPSGYSRLILAAKNSEDLLKAVEALGRTQLVKTFINNKIILGAPLPVDQTILAGALRDKKGIFALTDLGYSTDLTVAGAFHQDAYLDIPRPANFRAGESSYIELHFRHSKVLDPKKSAVTVYLNDIPIRSAALLPENAEDGTLSIPIPESELHRSFWRVKFAFYHDLGIIDCSKRYDDVAWSVIAKETNVHLVAGNIVYSPALENFPSDFFVSPGGEVNLDLLINQNATLEEINAALKLAYFIGAYNRNKLVWSVQQPGQLEEANTAGNIIAFGSNADVEYWRNLTDYLPVYPTGQNSYHVADWVESFPETLASFDIYQLGKVNDEKYLYAFMYASANDLNTLINSSLQKGLPLSGQVSLVDPQGNIISFEDKSAFSSKTSAWWENLKDRLGGPSTTYLVALFAVIVATVAVLLFTRKKA